MEFPEEVLDKLTLVKHQPAPINWRNTLTQDGGAYANWVFKRNYKACYYSTKNPVITGYSIYECSSNSKLVLKVTGVKLSEAQVRERCEHIIRTLAKGHVLRLNKQEKTNGVYNKEQIIFVPYGVAAS